MIRWKYSYHVNYSNAELKSALSNITRIKNSGIFEFLPTGVYFKHIQKKEFLAFKGGQNITSWVFAKVKHRQTDDQNLIDVQIGFTDLILWSTVIFMAAPLFLSLVWLFTDAIKTTELFFGTFFFLLMAIFKVMYLRWHLKSFEKDLQRFFTQLTQK